MAQGSLSPYCVLLLATVFMYVFMSFENVLDMQLIKLLLNVICNEVFINFIDLIIFNRMASNLTVKALATKY